MHGPFWERVQFSQLYLEYDNGINQKEKRNYLVIKILIQ